MSALERFGPEFAAGRRPFCIQQHTAARVQRPQPPCVNVILNHDEPWFDKIQRMA